MDLPDKEIVKRNHPPVIQPVPLTVVNESEEILIELEISDPDGDPLEIGFGGWSPEGAVADLSVPLWRYQTDFGDAGDYSIWVAASDGEETVRKDVFITVNNVNRPPQCPELTPLSVEELGTLNHTFRATDPDKEDNLLLAYKMDWSPSAPSGVTSYIFSPLEDKVDFSFTPAFGDRGNYSLIFSVTDPSLPPYTISCPITLRVEDVLYWESAGDFPDWITQAVVNSLAFNPYSSTLYAGLSSFFDPQTQPDPEKGYGVYKYSPYLNSWDEDNNGLTDLRVLDMAFATGTDNFYLFAATASGVYRNSGLAWMESSDGIPHENRRIFTLELDPLGRIWAGPGSGSAIGTGINSPLYFSSDDAGIWNATCYQNQCNPNPGYMDGITDLIRVYDLESGGIRFVASVFRQAGFSFYNSILISSDQGVSWREDPNFGHLPSSSRVVAFDPGDAGRMYLGVENQGIYRTADGGATWAGPVLLGNVPTSPRVILPLPLSDYPNTLMVGITQRGIFRSRDGGVTFKAQNWGLPDPVSVRSIAVDPYDLNRIYIGTEYHGVYRTKIP